MSRIISDGGTSPRLAPAEDKRADMPNPQPVVPLNTAQPTASIRTLVSELVFSTLSIPFLFLALAFLLTALQPALFIVLVMVLPVAAPLLAAPIVLLYLYEGPTNAHGAT